MLALLAAVLCANAGTAIGHPTISGANTNLNFTTLELDVDEIQLRRCDQSQLSVDVDDVLEEGDTLTLPSGCFDRMRIVTNGLYAEGTGAGGTFTLDLSPGTLVVDVQGDFDIPGGTSATVTLASTDWVTASMLNLSPGFHHTVDWSDSLFDTLGNAVRDDSTLTW